MPADVAGPPRILLVATRPVDPAQIATTAVRIEQISPLQVVPCFAAMKEALSRHPAPHYRTVAFTSGHAVEVLLAALSSLGQDARALGGVTLAAGGPTTAARLGDFALRADVIAEEGGGAALADALLASHAGGPLLFPRAKDGRDELPERLRAAGWVVDVVEAYEALPDTAVLGAAARAHRAQPFAAVGFASPRGAQVLLEVLGGARGLAGVTVGAIGATTEAALRAAGVPVAVVASRPSLVTLVDELAAQLLANVRE